MLLGLYSEIIKSDLAAKSTLSFISSYGVIKSLKLILQLSCISGAPTIEPAADDAVIPGTITTFFISSSLQSSKISPAIPYIPASPVLIIATSFSLASFMASLHLSSSLLIPVE